MARTVAEIEEAARQLRIDAQKNGAKAPSLTIELDEAHLLVKQHQANRVATGRPAPEARYVMKKLQSGKVQMHGTSIVCAWEAN